jgi:predicted lactoylglutathione lyase
VDEVVLSATSAGGGLDPTPKQEFGTFMYGRSFEDLDGHIWEVMWMDVAQFEAMSAQGESALEPA